MVWIVVVCIFLYWLIGFFVMAAIDNDNDALLEWAKECPIGGFYGYIFTFHWGWPYVVYKYRGESLF